MLSEQVGVWAKRYHQEGRQEGLLEGEAKLLRKLMERRFGALPTWVKDKLAQANQGDLETWGEAILTAPTLEAIFTDTSTH